MFDSFSVVNFTPVSAFVGGLIIGLSALWVLAAQGRIAGISGICGGLLGRGAFNDRVWQAAFILGLLLAGFMAPQWAGDGVDVYGLSRSQSALVLAGLLVGFGTRLGSGCTSGHGVCGLGRLSPRSMVATAIFMGAGFASAALITHLGGGAL